MIRDLIERLEQIEREVKDPALRANHKCVNVLNLLPEIIEGLKEKEALRIVRDEAVRALEIIRGHTNADDATSYRADDREGCLDGVFAEADRALAYIAKVEPVTPPTAADGER